MLWIRSAFFALAGPGTVLAWGPRAILASTRSRFGVGALRWLGLPLLVVGVGTLLWCIWDFARQGRGTLAPVDAPRFVVRGGPYRFVRNPMYVSVVTALVGETILFRSSWLLGWAGAFAAAFATFVVTYEEPTLRRRFGQSYEDYRSRVPRWLPRWSPTDPRR